MPSVYRIKDFAVHGGTAINLFYHNLPRYSVDIDLTYIPIQNREVAFSYSDYEKARINLINMVNANLTDMDKQFLLSFEEVEPKWAACWCISIR